MEKLHLLLKYAQIFKNPSLFSSKMRLYTTATVVKTDSSSSYCSSSHSQSTMVDRHGGARPFWWFPMEFQINKHVDLTLVLCIKSRRTALCPNKKIGLVHLPVKILLEDYWRNSTGNFPKHAAFTISSRSGKFRGVIYLSYSFVGEQSRQLLLPPPPRIIPSAPPLPEHECIDCHFLRQSEGCDDGNSTVTTTIPSAPFTARIE